MIAEVDASAAGAIIDSMNQRKGELLDMAALPAGKQALRFLVPSRGMIGYKGVFTALTGGEGTLQRAFAHYGTHRGPLGQLRRGVIVSTATGTAKAHALEALESRGTFFIRPGDDVYAGMVVGESNKEGEVEVNPTREKHVTNVRSTVREELCRLAPPRVMSLEEIIG